MDRDIENILFEELSESGNIFEEVVSVLDSIEPSSESIFNIVPRTEVPRNQLFYEETIPLYVGDLFRQHFRLSREQVEILTNQIGHLGVIPICRKIPLEKKILFTIWVLAKPESFLACGDRFSFAKSTGHKIFKDVIQAICLLMPQYITWPNNHDDTIAAFQGRSRGFPGVVGAIDGCHIPIKQPSSNPNDYYNRKQFHSIILQGICNHRKLFTDIFVGVPGRVHDARVFRHSDIYQALIDNHNPLLEQEMHIIGDSAYPLMLNLLTPFRDNGHLNDDQVRYNVKLSMMRSVIERTFGLLKGKFRRLKYLDIKDPDLGSKIITTCCILHNLMLLNGDEGEEDIHEEETNEVNDAHNPENESMQSGVLKRENIVNLLREL